MLTWTKTMFAIIRCNLANKIFRVLACLGLIFAIIVHIISLFGIYIENDFPFFWLLHVGVFIVWFPAVAGSEKHSDSNQNFFSINTGFYEIFFKNIPKRVIFLTAFFCVYGFINFLITLAIGQGGLPDIVDGNYVLSNHNVIIKDLTKSEFIRMKANELRGFSGHWMIFYSVAMALLWRNKEKI